MSPVPGLRWAAALNRGVAVAMTFGPEAGLEAVDALLEEPSLQAYHLLPAVRGDLLRKLGRVPEARAEFERAASLTRNARERQMLERRAAEWAGHGEGAGHGQGSRARPGEPGTGKGAGHGQ